MPLGVTWWSGGGEASRWTHDFSGYKFSFLQDGQFVRCQLSRARLYQRPYVSGGYGGVSQSEAGYDIGHFFLVRDQFPMTDDTHAMTVELIGARDGFGVVIYQPQWVELDPVVNKGALNPVYDPTPYYVGNYKTGFVYDRGTPRLGLGNAPPPLDNADIVIWFKDYPGVLCKMWHYNPWAWFGTVPEVVAAISMKSGLDSSFIDTVGFDNAYDAYDLTTGDPPWTTGSSKWEIHCWRKVGQSCFDLLADCMRHSRDMYFINEAGKFSVSSFTRPNNILSSLSYDDGVIQKVSWFWSSEFLFNSVSATRGAATRTYGISLVQPTSSNFSAVDEPMLESYQKDAYKTTQTTPTSISKYGEIYFSESKNKDDELVNQGGSPRNTKSVHYPFLLSSHGIPFSNIAHITKWSFSDAKPRKMITLKQDMQGLNFAIGDQVQNVELTSDGETVADTRCIRKMYNFKDLTVESLIMEIPDNTTAP